jgi:di/tricarboxylate transporter
VVDDAVGTHRRVADAVSALIPELLYAHYDVVAEAYRGVSWTTVILVAGMIPLSTAMCRRARC